MEAPRETQMEMMKMTRGIYRIATNEGTLYVGQSVDVERRLQGHKSSLQRGAHTNSYLQRVYDKSPKGITIFELIEEVPEGDMYPRESHWISELRARCNMVIPAEDGWTFSEETRKKMSKAGRGRIQSSEHIQKRIANSVETRLMNDGYSVTEETRRKISKAGRGRKQTAEHVEKRTAYLHGRTVPEETRVKISASVRATTSTKEYRDAQSERIKKGMAKPGVSAKISASRKGKPAWNKGIPRPESVKKALSEDWAKRPIVECPLCGREFKLLASHMTKKHGVKS